MKVGTGPEVAPGSRVAAVDLATIEWLLCGQLTRLLGAGQAVSSTGAESPATQFDPFIFTVGDGRAIVGVDEGVRGMRQGGTRRPVIPIKAGYTTVDKSAGPPIRLRPRRQIERELAKRTRQLLLPQAGAGATRLS